MTPADNQATLQGLRVLDCGERAATAWCSRLLADYGADVVMIEPAGGHELRHHPPFDADGKSTTARYFLANKRAASFAEHRKLATQADVIVTSGDPRELVSDNPAAIVCAITPGGLTGALANAPGNELTAYARSGWASVNGMKSGPPLKGSGYQAAYQAGTLAYGAIVAALIERSVRDRDDTRGQVIDIAELEVLVSTFAPALLRTQYSGAVWERRAAVTMNDGPVPVRDGHFALPLSRPAFWRKAMHLLGLPDLAEDAELQQPGLRHRHQARYAKRVGDAMAKWTRMELFAALAAERVVAGPVLAVDEMGDNPQLQARGFFRSPQGSRTRFPGPFARMGESPWRLTHEMPDEAGRTPADAGPTRYQDRLQEQAASAAQGTAALATNTRRRVQNRRTTSKHGGVSLGPLAGFRGLVLTQAWAGTYATQLLALLGAEVIQLETRHRLDSWRGTYQNPIPKQLQAVTTAEHAWNCNPLYNSVNLNKRCITVNLATPEGVQIFKDLLPHVDFVAENFSPRVMGNLGLDYETLKAIKPELVMASLSAYGATGPWANVPGIGGTIEPSSGMSSLLGYEGGEPQNSGQMYPDPVAGLCGFAAIATALLHRERTGDGQYIDLSMQEANFVFIGDAWLEFAATGNVRRPTGNRHPLYAPHGIYSCRGDDQWIAIAAETDAQFQAIANVLGFNAEPFAQNTQRKACEHELDALLGAKTACWDKHGLADALAAAGVPSAPVLNAAEVVADENLRQRGHLARLTHAETGAMWQSGAPVRFSATPLATPRAAPLHGEHSFAVFSELLGMNETRYAELVAKGVTGKGPPPAAANRTQP